MKLIDRLQRKSMPEPNTGCWIWIGAVNKKGYGSININGKMDKTHRVSYRLFKGSFNKKLFVCHSCDVPSCINPDHLFLGTAKDNAVDRVNKNRSNSCRGDSHGRSSLCEDDVLFIRESGMRPRDLMRIFDVDRSTIWRVLRSKNWTHI